MMPTFSNIFMFICWIPGWQIEFFNYNFSNGKCGREKNILKEKYEEEKCLAHRERKFQLSEP